MSDFLRLPREKFRVIPLGIDTSDFTRPPRASDESASDSSAQSRSLPSNRPDPSAPVTIGYLARLAPEKGLHLLADAFIQLRQMPGCERTRLRIAGWLGKQHQEYVDEVFRKFSAAQVDHDVEHIRDLDRRAKLDYLDSLDLLSVPTTYREPKGLFVLEAMAAGIPVVQPAHGAFPELLDSLQGGILFPPNDATALAQSLAQLVTDSTKRNELGEQGRVNVHAHRNARRMAENLLRAVE